MNWSWNYNKQCQTSKKTSCISCLRWKLFNFLFKDLKQGFRMFSYAPSTHPPKQSTDIHIFNGNLFCMYIFCFYFLHSRFPPTQHLGAKKTPLGWESFSTLTHTHTESSRFSSPPLRPPAWRQLLLSEIRSLNVCFTAESRRFAGRNSTGFGKTAFDFI